MCSTVGRTELVPASGVVPARSGSPGAAVTDWGSGFRQSCLIAWLIEGTGKESRAQILAGRATLQSPKCLQAFEDKWIFCLSGKPFDILVLKRKERGKKKKGWGEPPPGEAGARIFFFEWAGVCGLLL